MAEMVRISEVGIPNPNVWFVRFGPNLLKLELNCSVLSNFWFNPVQTQTKIVGISDDLKITDSVTQQNLSGTGSKPVWHPKTKQFGSV